MQHNKHGRGRSQNSEVTYLMIKIAIILGSTRPNRNGEAVAKWVCDVAKTRSDAESELVDIKDFNLPLLDEPVPPSMGQYSKPSNRPNQAVRKAPSSSWPQETLLSLIRS